MEALKLTRSIILYGVIALLALATPKLPDCTPKWDTKPGGECPDKGWQTTRMAVQLVLLVCTLYVGYYPNKSKQCELRWPLFHWYASTHTASQRHATVAATTITSIASAS